MTATLSRDHSVLATHLLPSERVRRGVLSVLCVVLGSLALWASAKIQVPFHPVPMTMQTYVVLVLAAAFGWRIGVSSVLLYLAEGMAGLPVFANTPPMVAGPAYLLGTTGGFLAGFVLAAAVTGALAERGWDRSWGKVAVMMALGHALIFACGVVWLAFGAHLASGATGGIGFEKAWAGGVAPFYYATALKTALAALTMPLAWRMVKKI